jgi:hypothetical protein
VLKSHAKILLLLLEASLGTNKPLLLTRGNNPKMSLDIPALDSVARAIFTAWQSVASCFTWENLKYFGNSAFTTSLVGALAGAYFGARSAQLVAERGKLRDELTKEIRNVNATIALSFGIANSMLALKKQHVAVLKRDYDTECQRHRDYSEKRKTGQIQGNEPFVLNPEFRTMPSASQPLPVLQDIVFGRLSTVGRPFHLVASLGQVLENLNAALAQHNELIEMFKDGKFPPGANISCMYLALPYGDGHVNRQYQGLVEAISSYTDNAIFFSVQLCKDLHEYGDEVAKTFKKSFKHSVPRVAEVDFKQAEADAMMPNSDDYKGWLAAFQKLPKPPRKWWQRAA